MLGPAPSASGDPSIWYAEVAAPQSNCLGNSYVIAGARCTAIYLYDDPGTTGATQIFVLCVGYFLIVVRRFGGGDLRAASGTERILEAKAADALAVLEVFAQQALAARLEGSRDDETVV